MNTRCAPGKAGIPYGVVADSGVVLDRETHRRQQLTPALTLPQARYELSLLLLEVLCTPGVDYICRQVQRQSG